MATASQSKSPLGFYRREGNRAIGGHRQTHLVDEIDLRILRILQRDGRVSKTALAGMVNLSPSSCIERMHALEKKKLITSYSAHINVRLLASLEVFFTEVTLKSHRYEDFFRFEKRILAMSCVVECFALGGGVDYILKVVVSGVDHYQGIMEELLEAEIGIERYFTYICTKQVKSTGSIPLESILGEETRKRSA